MKTYINKLNLTGFKSFNRKTDLHFEPGLNCVVGPNGAGKSNILDALCFALGRLSTKSLRAENYLDLIYNKKGKQASGGSVVFHLDNSSNIFPVDSKILEITRQINKEGQTKYYINKKRATRKQVVELLSMSKINPDGHNIILQGDIDKFISMSPVEKRQVIEDVAGIWVYETKKENALKELNKVEEKVKEARIVLVEKDTYMKSLEEDKKTAEKYLNYTKEKDRAKATEFKIKIDSINRRKSKVSNKLSFIEKVHSSIDSKINNVSKKIDIINQKIDDIDLKIEKKGGEDQLSLQKEIDALKTTVENSKNLIFSSKNEIQRIDSRRIQLKKNLQDLNEKLAEKINEKSQLESQKKQLLNREDAIKKRVGVSGKNISDLEQDLEKIEETIASQRDQKVMIKEQLNKLSSNLDVISYKLKNIEEKRAQLKEQERRVKNIGKSKERYKKIIEEINNLSVKNSKISLQLTDLRRKSSALEDKIARLRVSMRSTQDLLMRDRSINLIIKHKKNLIGVHGTVAELGQVDSQYSTALQVAAGGRMKNIVVDNESIAIKCLRALKEARAGVATFLLLTKIKVPFKSEIISSALNKEGVIGLASDLISCEAKYKPLFRYVFKNTLIVEDSNIAKRLGIGKFNMVTLDGDIFRSSGEITGGFRRIKTGLEFAEKDTNAKIMKLNKELSDFKKKIKILEKERNISEENILKLRTEKAELEGKVELIDNLKLDPEQVNKEFSDLMRDKNEINQSIRKFKNQIDNFDKSLENLTLQKNALKSKIKELQFGESKAKLNKLSLDINIIEGKLSALNAAIVNVLSPEKDNISRVLSSLNKEKQEFNYQIKEQENILKTNEKKLKIKEKEEKEFFGSLKRLFEQKNKLSELMKKENMNLKEFEKKKLEDSEEKNALSIAKAKLEAEAASVKEEIANLKDNKILPYLKTINDCKRKQEDMENKIESLGNVNMKALEIYESVKKEFDNLTWKVNKLSSERESIINVINKIETKKTSTFINTFEQVGKNFNKIFSKMTDKIKASIVLENQHEPFEGGIRIKISDAAGKAMFLGALSGGEKTLVALAFIFAIQDHEPAPFYLLDEIDAALDKVNSEKVAALLKEYSNRAQVIIISHNDSIVAASDSLYGIWMNKDGESFAHALKI